MIKIAKLKDLTGMKFGKLVVVNRGKGKRAPNGKLRTTWICKCDCGNFAEVSSNSLLKGHTKSCGCLTLKHGFANTEPLYEVWKNMKRRCYEKSNKRYANYGGRGIVVCDEWKNDYLSFRNWALDNGYKNYLTIDRIDVNGNYCPENCRWATAKTQANNTTRNHVIYYRGISLDISEWAELLGISYSTMNHRVQRHWSMNRITTTPQRGNENEFKGLPAERSTRSA